MLLVVVCLVHWLVRPTYCPTLLNRERDADALRAVYVKTLVVVARGRQELDSNASIKFGANIELCWLGQRLNATEINPL